MPSPPPATSVEGEQGRPNSPTTDHTNKYGYDIDKGDASYSGTAGLAEDGTRESEASVLGDSNSSALAHTTPLDAQSLKRPASRCSGASSDFEIPSSSRKGNDALDSKRRRINKGDNITDELEPSMVAEHLTTLQTSKYAGTSTKGKGKGKQLQREPSLDSVSTGAKAPRKKGTTKKKIDKFPPETLDIFGLGAASVSLSHRYHTRCITTTFPCTHVFGNNIRT
jgi:DNA helicase INO80